MTIIYNNETLKLPQDNMTISELAKWKKIPSQGAAIALNDTLIKKNSWETTELKDMDKVIVITAAFGG